MKVLLEKPIGTPSSTLKNRGWQPLILLNLLIAICIAGSVYLRRIDPTTGLLDQTIWILVTISLISFLLIVALSWWLLNQFWIAIGLPLLSDMVSQFYDLSLWQQFVLYWASFALLLLAGTICLIAIC